MSKNICGDCTLCCKLPPIFNENEDKSLDYNNPFKKFGEWCVNCSTRKACDIYENRPNVCREFNCLYVQSVLQNDPMDDAWHPRVANFFVTIENQQRLKERQISIYINPERHYDIFTKKPYMFAIKNWLDENWMLIVNAGTKVYAYKNIEGRYFELKFPEPFVFGKRNITYPDPTQEIFFGRKQ